MTIENPILRGFNPDPSIVRVGSDYYIATSTFEWYPGVQIHHSTDLANWRLLTRPLARESQLDMRGNPNSGGIWAPCLTYADGLFWLIYTDVKQHQGSFKTTHNYLATAETILGPWSDPVYLNSSGFDPSLFHDEDGRKWLVNMEWDWRPGHNRFRGILLQEYDAGSATLVGNPINIFRGTELGFTEGPHLYKHGNYYYLITAEGGTGHEHAVTMARSDRIDGPYEVDPSNPILTSVANDSALRKSGHADLVETPDGWYLVHLCSRPVGHGVRDEERGWSILGRETAIQKVEWTDDEWLRLEGGGNVPSLRVEAPASLSQSDTTPTATARPVHCVDDFDTQSLPIDWQWLRSPRSEELFGLSERPGYLRLFGRETLISQFGVSLVARRFQAFAFTAVTTMEFEPEDFHQMAGLVCYYDTTKFHYLYVSTNDSGQKILGIWSAHSGKEFFPLQDNEVLLPDTGPLSLRVNLHGQELQFSWSSDDANWQTAGEPLDATLISDEARPGGMFTGAFVGMTCQDVAGLARHADFDRFEYREME